MGTAVGSFIGGVSAMRFACNSVLHSGTVCIIPANSYVAASVAVGAAVGSFIGGVLLTAAIAGIVARVVFFMAKRKFTTKLE